MCGGGGSISGQLRREAAERERKIRLGQAEIDRLWRAFDEDFYKQREKAYLDYALPALGSQYREAQQRLGYALSSRGLLRGSVAGEATQSLEREMARQRRNLADTAMAQAQQLRQRVEDTRMQLYNQLVASQDPTMARISAAAAASTFQAPSPITPVANLLSDWTSLYLDYRLGDLYRRQAQAVRTAAAAPPTALPPPPISGTTGHVVR